MNAVPTVAAFDLANFDCVALSNAGVDVEIKHPVTNEPMGIVVTVLGADGNVFTAASRAQAEKLRARVAKNGGYRPGLVSDEEKEEEQLELLCACVVRWTGLVMNGAPVECNNDNKEELFSKLPWLKEQVEAAILSRKNFIKG